MVSKALWKQVSTTVLEDWNQSRTSCCLESFDNNNCVISKLCMLSFKKCFAELLCNSETKSFFPPQKYSYMLKNRSG